MDPGVTTPFRIQGGPKSLSLDNDDVWSDSIGWKIYVKFC